MFARALIPHNLPNGFVLSGWQVVAWRGRGTYGAVYRAQRAGQESAGPVALKLAIHPKDERFGREAEVLARVAHPGLPHVLARGELTCGYDALPHPWLVMEWIEGVPLYGAPRSPSFTVRQALQVLAQLARALEALHGAGCLHRDVKGENVLVEDTGRAVLVDLGCGTWVAAPRLTEGPLPPGTPRYRSPEAVRWRDRHWKSRKRYETTPADDVYALGVLAYRLCTGQYPPSAEDIIADKAPRRQPARALNGRVPRELSQLIERMLSEAPRERGAAGELAEALEALAPQLGSGADGPLLIGEELPREAPTVTAEPPTPRASRIRVLAPLVALATVMALAVTAHRPRTTWSASSDPEDGGTSGLVDAAVEETMASIEGASGLGVPGTWIAMEMPKKPLPGQRRPPCAPRMEIAIRGGCWVKVADEVAPCGDNAFDYEGACYMPSFTLPRPSTSEPP